MPAQRTLLLITASSPAIRRVRRSRVLNFQQITMPYLAAFVPPKWKVIHIDEEVSPIDITIAVDLVGITFHTPSAFHVYDLAAQFRKRGIPVALYRVSLIRTRAPIGTIRWTGFAKAGRRACSMPRSSGRRGRRKI